MLTAESMSSCMPCCAQDMLWSMLPFMDAAHGVRQPRRAVATAVRLLIFVLGVCIAFMVQLTGRSLHLHNPSRPIQWQSRASFHPSCRGHAACRQCQASVPSLSSWRSWGSMLWLPDDSSAAEARRNVGCAGIRSAGQCDEPGGRLCQHQLLAAHARALLPHPLLEGAQPATASRCLCSAAPCALCMHRGPCHAGLLSEVGATAAENVSMLRRRCGAADARGSSADSCGWPEYCGHCP